MDICAPGYDVYSTAYVNNYYASNGTSFAAPQVAGVAAMIMAVKPELTANEVVDILKSTADPTLYSIPQNSNYIGKLGTGRLDAYKAVKEACSVEIVNKIFSTIANITGCFISVDNTALTSGANVTLDATEEVLLNSNFEVYLGAELEVR